MDEPPVTDLVGLVSKHIPTFFSGRWGNRRAFIINTIAEIFTPPYVLSEDDLNRLDQLLKVGIPNTRDRLKQLERTLSQLNSCGLIQSPLPCVPLPEADVGIAPRERCVFDLAAQLNGVIEAIDNTNVSALRRLRPEILCALTYLALIADSGVCTTIANTLFSFARARDRRGSKWIWIPCSPACTTSYSGIFIPSVTRKLVAACTTQIEPRANDLLLIPTSLQASLSDKRRSEVFVEISAWVRVCISEMITTPAAGAYTWWQTSPGRTSTKHEEPLTTWWHQFEPRLLRMLSSPSMLHQAAKLRLYGKGLPPFAIELLFMPVLPAAADHDLQTDKVSGTSKRDLVRRYEFDPGRPPPLSQGVSIVASDPVEWLPPDPTEDVGCPASTAELSSITAASVYEFLRQAADLRKNGGMNSDYVGYLADLEILCDKSLQEASTLYPGTSSQHLMIRWLTHRLKSKGTDVQSLRTYVGRFASRHMLQPSIPIDVADWTADEVHQIVIDLSCDSRATTTKFSAVGHFAEFVKFVQTRTGSLLSDVTLVRGVGDLDFERRIYLPSERKLRKAVHLVAHTKALRGRNRERAALAILLMSGLGLRPKEALSVRHENIYFADGEVLIIVTDSKTTAGIRAIWVSRLLSGEMLKLFNQLLGRLSVSGDQRDVPITRLRGIDGHVLSYGTNRRVLTAHLRWRIHGRAKMFQQASRKNKAGKSPSIDLHSLRHFFASNQLWIVVCRSMRSNSANDAGLFIDFLKALGHRGPSTMAVHYCHNGERIRHLLLANDWVGSARSI